jgi:hypothetical protein
VIDAVDVSAGSKSIYSTLFGLSQSIFAKQNFAHTNLSSEHELAHLKSSKQNQHVANENAKKKDVMSSSQSVKSRKYTSQFALCSTLVCIFLCIFIAYVI